MKPNFINDMKIYKILRSENQLESFLNNRYINLTGTTILTTAINILVESQTHFFGNPYILCNFSFVEGVLLEVIMELIATYKQCDNHYKKKTFIEKLNEKGVAVNEESFYSCTGVITDIETDNPSNYFTPENIIRINQHHKGKTLKIRLYDTLTLDENNQFIIIRETVPKHIKGIKQTTVIYNNEDETEEKPKKLYRVNHK